MQRLTIKKYLQRPDAYPVTPATVRKYIDKGILPGEKTAAGTYFVHIIDEPQDNLLTRMVTG